MKLSNSYNFDSNINLSANIIGKGLELIKNKLFNNKEEKGAVNGKSVMEWSLSGEMTLDISVEEMVELHKEYGENFERYVNYLKKELRPICKEAMLAIDDVAKSILKTINDCEDLERIHDERVKAESEAREWEEKAKAAKEKKSE